MKRLVRRIIHYVGNAIRFPIALMLLASIAAMCIAQLASCVVHMAFDEPIIEHPVVWVADVLSMMSDTMKNTLSDR